MGNKNSNRGNEEKTPLLEDYEGIQPVFNELKLVLIGSHGDGKNSIGNEIFRKKVFTCWRTWKNVNIEVTHTVSGRQIQLTHTPGWKDDLNNPQKTKRKILHCVQSIYHTKPHAVLLALKVESELPESTINTLEDFLSGQLWSHTIVIFTHGEKLGGSDIEKYIKYKRLQDLIEKCGQRYFVLEKNDKQIIETIEDLIVSKDSTGCFKPNNQTIDNDTLVSDLIDLVGKIRSKINSISDFKKDLRQHNEDYKRIINFKDAEIERLNQIVEEKETKIKSLQLLLTQNPAQLGQQRIAELEKTLDLKNHELWIKDNKIKELQKEIKMLQKEDCLKQERENAHTGYCCNLAQDVQTVNSRRQTAIPLHGLPSENSALHNWGVTLLEILNELTSDELKKMIYYMMNWKDEYKIQRCSIEQANRIHIADLMLREWGKPQSVVKTRDLIKKIPRNDDVMIKLFTPVLKEIGETW